MASDPTEPSPRQSPLISLAHSSPSMRPNRSDTTPRSHTYESGYHSSSGSQHDDGYEVDRRTGERQLQSMRRSGPLDYGASRKAKFVEGSSSGSHGAGSLQRFAVSRSGPLSYKQPFIFSQQDHSVCLPSQKCKRCIQYGADGILLEQMAILLQQLFNCLTSEEDVCICTQCSCNPCNPLCNICWYSGLTVSRKLI